MTCAGCGGPLPPLKAPGRPRKWCSERCRKRQYYRGVCVDCGNPTFGRKIGDVPERCKGCAMVASAEHSRSSWLPYRRMVEQMWAEGMTSRQIAEALGWESKQPGSVICTLRERGYDLPRRRTPEQIMRMVGDGSALRKARAIYKDMRAA